LFVNYGVFKKHLFVFSIMIVNCFFVLRFLHCASRFYCALLHCPEGRHFMVNDRRGAVFKDILLEVDRVVRKADAERRGGGLAPKSAPTLGSKVSPTPLLPSFIANNLTYKLFFFFNLRYAYR
jgi:hypothetical protein